MNKFSAAEAKEVGIWIRVSSDEQAQGDSPEHHLERGKAYAAARGWTVKEIYDLAGVSGKSVVANAESQRMMRDIKSRHITGLIFSKLARLSRNKRELEDFAEFFRAENADMISIQDSIDTSTPSGRMFYTFQAAQTQWEREEITERIKASVAIRAKLGKTINGRAPYGYQWKDRKLVIQPDEAPIRRKAYELFLRYRRKGTVAKLLNADGHRTREGVLWSDVQVGRVLRESSAKGLYYFNRVNKDKGIVKPESEWGKIECETIVSPELWEQVNQITEEQLKKWKKPGRMPTHVFGNLTWCHCGGKMYARNDSPKFHCRKCNHKIAQADLDDIVRNQLHVFFGSSEQVQSHMSDAERNLTEKEQALEAQKREVQKVRDEMGRTHRLYVEGHITPQGFGEFYKPAEERLNQLQAGLPKLEAEVAFLKTNHVSAEDVLHEARTLYDQWPKLTTDEKRKIAESVIERIVIGKGEIDITLSYLPSSEEPCKSQQQMAPATC
jgi:site-specific DNA recombinase